MTFIAIFLLPNPTHAQSLNGTWAFRTDPNDIGEQQGWFSPSANVANWDSLPVPGNWDLRNEYAHYVGKGWYRRTFATPANGSGDVVRLLFEGVYHDCTVWLNGQKLGENHSGFLPFEFDITNRLNANGLNTLVVCADNTLTRGAIWNWGGIRRPVSLKVTKSLRIVRQHITPTVDLSKKTATVAVRVFVQNHSAQPAEATGMVELSAPNRFRRSLPFRVNVPASSTASVLVQTALTPAETHLWHFDDPFLYTSAVSLDPLDHKSISSQTESGHSTSPSPFFKERGPGGEVKSRFGIRKIGLDNATYTLKLNGESIRPMGFNLVPDDRTTGNTLPTWRIKEDIDLLKGMGCTMTRLSHLCLPEEVMDYLDERGMLVISEIPIWGYDRLADSANPMPTDWLTRLVTNQYNHPSVIAWSVGNEYGEFPTALDYTKQAIPFVRTLDSTRLVSCVSHTAQFTPDILDVGDIGFVNRYGKNLRPVTQQLHQLHPKQTLFYTEYGTGILGETLDTGLNARSLIDSLRGLPYLIGGSLWTFNDYRSRFHGTKEFSENRAWGVVDVYRQKKRAYASFRREHNPLRDLSIKTEGTSAVVTLVPRQLLDLPAYPLHGYRLLWKRTDAAGKIGQSGLIKLPDIRPGDPTRTQTFAWQPDQDAGADAFAMTLELLAPTGDALADTTIFYQKPLPVRITYALGSRIGYNGHSGGGTIRVHFQKNQTATAYKVRYGEGSLTQETPPTLNSYVDVPKLTFGNRNADRTYQVAVVGINGFGESEPTNAQAVTVEKIQFAPPAIQHVEPADGGFFIGYASPEDDYAYRVQVTTKPGDYATARTIQTTNPGTLFVSNLTNGQPYYFRFQRLKDNYFASNWSEERTVVPDGGQRPNPPVFQGVVRENKETVVCFAPVPKAIGYLLEYRRVGSGSWQREQITTAQTGRFILMQPDSTQRYEYRMATLTANGQSIFSPILTTQPDAKGRRNP
ncbi:sugar-binding domain-containing protein [Spirosoma montaniterrae]|uniref:sugar-binding domain-containing protein n=1 Tax=Spirosoma montaniterrae TaxID=1178516 RepID=UPI001E5F74A7|nr:sugar-binding domain-containing protein [Spirosoma montaniterrae]